MSACIRRASILVLAVSLLLPTAARAAQFHVTRADDPLADTCAVADCSLREAVTAAAATPEADEVILPAGQFLVEQGHLQTQGTVLLRGAGMDATRIVGSGAYALLHTGMLGELAVQDLELFASSTSVIKAELDSALILRRVQVPANGGTVRAGGNGFATVTVQVEHSRIQALDCAQSGGTCTVSHSHLEQGFGAVSDDLDAEISDSTMGPPTGGSYVGIGVIGDSRLSVRDSTVRNTLKPLLLLQGPAAEAPDIVIRRTRFIDNYGPMSGDRPSQVLLHDVEVRGHRIGVEGLPWPDAPAVLLAGPGLRWRFDRALIHDNRGGGTDGAVIRVLSGGGVALLNSTLHDNGFNAHASGGFGDTIGVYAGDASPATVFIAHSTLSRAPGLPADAVGSLLTVRGPAAQVAVLNSVLRGTCGFGGGGAIANGAGNVEAPGTSCGFAPGSNQSSPELVLHLGPLEDHGGYTWSFKPGLGSVLLDQGNETVCRAFPADQRGYPRDADGVDCDIGAIESAAVAPQPQVFRDGFED